MTINTRKKQNSKNNYTRKIHKGGSTNLKEEDVKLRETMQAIDDIKKKRIIS